MSHDEVPAILPPYDPQVSVWACEGKRYKQHDLVPEVGLAKTYSVWLHGPPSADPRFLTVQDNRITNLMAHQPVANASVFDRWGKYLGRGGEALERPGGAGTADAVSLVELAQGKLPPRPTPPVSAAIEAETVEPTRTFLEPPSEEGAGDGEEVECHLHRFWLREDLEVKVKLPIDITEEEAERFAVFVTTLPLAARKQG